MSKLINIQYSVFSNIHIKPSAEIINDMLTELNKIGEYNFIPNIIIGQNIDIPTGRIVPLNNISYITVDQRIQIACLNERIDVTINNADSSQSDSLFELIVYARKMLALVMKKNWILSNRLALNISLLSDTLESSIFESCIGKKYCKTLDFYLGEQLDEWSTRTNVKKEIKMDQNELLNIITEVSSIIDGASGKRRFLCHMDINTIYENNGYRFSWESLEKFDNRIVSIVEEIKQEFDNADKE